MGDFTYLIIGHKNASYQRTLRLPWVLDYRNDKDKEREKLRVSKKGPER